METDRFEDLPKREQEAIYIAAELYFHGAAGKGARYKPWSQADIAKELQVSQSKVSSLLDKARQFGIVEHNVHQIIDDNLRDRLIEKFPHLDAVVIVPSHAPVHDSDMLFSRLGLELADYYNKLVDEGDSIGISCGRSIAAGVREISMQANERGRKSACRVYPLQILISEGFVGNTPAALAGQLMDAMDGPDGDLYHLPRKYSLEDEKTDAEYYLEFPGIKDYMEKIEHLNHYIIGIGGVSVTKEKWGRVSYEEMGFAGTMMKFGLGDAVSDLGGVGESMYQVFDAKGKILSTDPALRRVKKSILYLGLEKIREKVANNNPNENVIAIAGGTSKHESIHASLKCGIYNKLITDASTVNYILAREDAADG